jgi:hypothetical protein
MEKLHRILRTAEIAALKKAGYNIRFLDKFWNDVTIGEINNISQVLGYENIQFIVEIENRLKENDE